MCRGSTVPWTGVSVQPLTVQGLDGRKPYKSTDDKPTRLGRSEGNDSVGPRRLEMSQRRSRLGEAVPRRDRSSNTVPGPSVPNDAVHRPHSSTECSQNVPIFGSVRSPKVPEGRVFPDQTGWRRWDSNPRPPACKFDRDERGRTTWRVWPDEWRSWRSLNVSERRGMFPKCSHT